MRREEREMNTFTTIFKKTREKRDGLVFLRVLTVIMALGAVVLISSCCDDLFPAEEPGKEETGTKPDGGGDTLLRRRTVMDSIDCLLKSGKKIGIPDYLSAIAAIIAAIAAIITTIAAVLNLPKVTKSAGKLVRNMNFSNLARNLSPFRRTKELERWSIKPNRDERRFGKESHDLNHALSGYKKAILALLKEYPDGLSNQEICQKLSKYGEDKIIVALAFLKMEDVIVSSDLNWEWTDD
jgi:hypothetical protein